MVEHDPCRVAPLPRLAQISFRVTAATAPVAAGAVGLERLPLPGQFAAADGCNVFWLGPDEFLAIGADPVRASLEARLRAAIPSGAGAVVDVSASRSGIHLSGPGARDALAGCCPLDFHPRVFRAGACAGTLIAKAQVIIAQISDAPSYLILVRPSFAQYVRDWLLR